jgi:peptide/nickel transport system substrate-binding protein
MKSIREFAAILGRRRKRVALATLFGIVFLGVVWSLTSSSLLQVTTGASASASSADSARQRSVIRIRFEAEPSNLNPWLHSSIYSHFISGYIYDSLLEQDPVSFEWHGRLAETWREQLETLPSGEQKLRFTFRLREAARFHDGRPVSADDVAFSLAAIRLPQLKSPLVSYYSDIDSVRVIDSKTVEVTYKRPYWMARKHVGELHILPRHIFDPQNLIEKNPDAFADGLKKVSAQQLPIGSGPYSVVDWQRGSQLILQRRERVGDAYPNAASTIVFKFIPDHSAALLSLKNGEIDFIPRMDAELFESELQKADSKTRFQSATYYTEYLDFIAWNLKREFFSDRRVRQALAYGALDKKEFLSTVLNGRGVEVTGSQYYFGPAYNHEVKPIPYNPSKARELLAQAGWIDRNGDGTRDRNGVEFKFQLSLRAGNRLARQRAAVIQQTLAQLQIKMEIREMELGAFAAAVSKRDFDACSLGWQLEKESDPFQLWHSSQVGEDGSNLPGLSIPEVDRLIEKSRSMMDDTDRRKLIQQIHVILYEEQPYLFFFCRPNLAIYSSKLRDVRFYPVRPGYRIEEWKKAAE